MEAGGEIRKEKSVGTPECAARICLKQQDNEVESLCYNDLSVFLALLCCMYLPGHLGKTFARG